MKRKRFYLFQKNYRKKFCFCKQQRINKCNNLLNGYKNTFNVSDPQIDLRSLQTSSQLNCIFTSAAVKRTLPGKVLEAIDGLCPFVAAFIDRATKYSKKTTTNSHARFVCRPYKPTFALPLTSVLLKQSWSIYIWKYWKTESLFQALTREYFIY